MCFKCWRSRKDGELHLICREGAEAFEALPAAIRNLGPWTGSKEGEVDRLRLPYRTMLTEQGFTIVHAHVSKLQLETVTGAHGLHPANVECRDCKGTGQVDQHGGLRQKMCWRCAGREWLRRRPADRASKEWRGDTSACCWAAEAPADTAR
jgi:hypothetical protein